MLPAVRGGLSPSPHPKINERKFPSGCVPWMKPSIMERRQVLKNFNYLFYFILNRSQIQIYHEYRLFKIHLQFFTPSHLFLIINR